MRLLELSIALTVVLCGVAVVESGISCRSHYDCGKGQCCRVYYKGKKRAVTGMCEALGTAGSVCLVSSTYISDHVSVRCPCEKGRECEGTGTPDAPNFGELGYCGPKSCKTSSDCADDECCVDPNRPKGKRRRAAGSTCQPLKQAGESCLVSYGSGQPTDTVFLCPCQSGLDCVANGVNDQPLGPLGDCTE